MVDKKWLNKNYYFNAMSKFLLNSYGTEERFDIYLKILKNIDNIGEDIFSRLDIYNVANWDESDYFVRNDVDKTLTDDKWLDLIAAIYNINRTMKVTYFDSRLTPPADVTESITLNNWELFIYIKVMISKLNYMGTTKEIIDLYGNGKPDLSDPQDIKYLGISYIWSMSSLNCQVILANNTLVSDFNNFTGNQNICKLFLSDYLLIESVGIQYSKNLNAKLVPAKFYGPSSTPNAKFYDPNAAIVHIFN